MPELSLFDIRVLSLLGVGFILGLKHAFDADHVIAVSTIVSEKKGFFRSSLVGVLWGAGHTASLLAVGLLIVAFDVTIPEKMTLLLEFAVALMLIGLGVQVLWKIHKGATFHLHAHKHEQRLHVHPHLHPPGEHAKQTDHHESPASVGKKPFFIGMVHGLAGSASLMLIVLTTISSRPLSLVYIGVFGIGSIGGMFLMSMVVGIPFFYASNHQRLHTTVRIASGVLSVCFGVILAFQIGIEFISLQ